MNTTAETIVLSTRIAIKSIVPSRTHIQEMRRARFDKAALKELAQSIAEVGVLQPILVRQDPKKEKDYELVAGERRFLAAQTAKVDEIHAVVRDLTDLQVLEIQMIENLQREGLHELEEAEGYDELMKTHGFTAEQIAEKVGKSRMYVYGRLKLNALCPEARSQFYAGKLDGSRALLLARIAVQDLQRQCLKEFLGGRHQNEHPMTFREAREHVQQTYMLRLDQAPFATGDADLLPKAGACGPCPKRTGNQPELFGDVKSKDVCTDPVCFSAKKAAHMEKQRKEHEARGHTVISGEEAKKLKPQHYSDVKGDFVELDKHEHIGGSYTTWRKALGKAAPQPTLLQDPHDQGKFIEIVPRPAAIKVLAGKGVKVGYTSGRGNGGDREREKKARLETAYNQQIFDAIRAKPIKLGRDELEMIAQAHWSRLHYEAQKPLLALYGWKSRFGGDSEKAIAQMDDTQLARLLLDLTLAPEIRVGFYEKNDNENLEAIAKKLGVNTVAIRKTLIEEKKAKQKKKKTKKVQPAATKPAKASATSAAAAWPFPTKDPA